MRQRFLILSILALSANICFSQNLKDISAGAIDFLLRNPKTANRMNASESTALDIIGDLLKTASERKYQLEYAAAGRNQIMLNTNDGRQAQFVKNENGKIFLLVEGIIYPIAQELINEAEDHSKTEGITKTPDTNIGFNYDSELSNYYNSESYKIEYYKEPYIVGSDGEYMNEIMKKTGATIEYIGDENYRPLASPYRENKMKLPANKKLTIAPGYPKNVIFPMFGFKWVRDLNGNNTYEFEEFNQKKKVFYDNENFYIAIPVIAGKYCEAKLYIELYNNYTGELIKSDNKFIAKNKLDFYFFYIQPNELKSGSYGVNSRLENLTIKDIATRNTTFEIIKGNPETLELNLNEKKALELEKSAKEQVAASTPKDIFFYNSWTDLNSNGKYDFNEFIGLNKPYYNLKKEKLYMGINFPNKSGEIIIQSWTKEGKLLGTTTTDFQKIPIRLAGVGLDPYQAMDFIDMIQINGPGEYKVSVSFVEGGTYEKIVLIKE